MIVFNNKIKQSFDYRVVAWLLLSSWQYGVHLAKIKDYNNRQYFEVDLINVLFRSYCGFVLLVSLLVAEVWCVRMAWLSIFFSTGWLLKVWFDLIHFLRSEEGVILAMFKWNITSVVSAPCGDISCCLRFFCYPLEGISQLSYVCENR